MLPIANWDEIKPYDEFSLIEPGAYMVRIIRLDDQTHTADNYLGVVYDVYNPAEQNFMFTEELKDPSNDWKHTQRFYFNNPVGEKIYKQFVIAIEDSPENRGYKYSNREGAERELVGKYLGAVIRHTRFLKDDGNEGVGVEVAKWITTDQMKEKKFNPLLLNERDNRNRKKKRTSDMGTKDIPF